MNDALTPLPYLYTAYGLTLASAFPCPQVPSGAGCPEVALRYGPFPPDLDSAAHHGDGSAVTPTQALIQVPGIGRYLVSAGREVVIEPAPHSSVEAIQALVFGLACGALLHQRGVLVLHGSAMVTPYGAVVFVGRSGEGKSTLAAAFYQRGYQLLADDVCTVLPTHATTPQLFPALPRLRLWADAVARFGWTAMELPRVHPAIEKYALPLPATFPTHPFPLAAVYELETGPDRTIHLTSLQGAHKLAVLLRHTYRAWWLPVALSWSTWPVPASPAVSWRYHCCTGCCRASRSALSHAPPETA